MVRILLELLRYESEQLLLDFQHGFTRGNPGSVCYSEDMGIDCDGRLSEGRIQDHVCRLAPDSGQGLQRFDIPGNLSLVPLEQQPTRCDDVTGFAVEQSDRADILLQA